MSRQNQRRLAALRAMAEQDASPAEAEIARVKLAELEAAIAAAPDELTTWQLRQRDELERARLQTIADESTRELLVKRWEHGTFTGVRIRAGAVTRLVEPR